MAGFIYPLLRWLIDDADAQLRRLKAGEVWQEDFGCNLFVFSDDFDMFEN